ncbi:MAG: DUF2508 family protein [Clostridia bacterium]|nr:DUF2508 family protein [Clostridia bacterium]
MGYEYVKEPGEIKDKNEHEKKMELILSVIKTKNDLENASKNYEYAEGRLIDYYLYEIKASQSKLDYLLKKAKQLGIEFDLTSSFVLKNKKII